MKQGKKLFVLMLLLSTLLGGMGQIFFKASVLNKPFSITLEFAAFVAAGVIFYLVSTAIYWYVLSRTHLSWAYGFTGLSYIFASVLAFFLLAESIPIIRWAGIVIITIGTLLVGSS